MRDIFFSYRLEKKFHIHYNARKKDYSIFRSVVSNDMYPFLDTF